MPQDTHINRSTKACLEKKLAKDYGLIIHLINSFLVDGDIMGKCQQTEPNDYEEILYPNNTKQKL